MNARARLTGKPWPRALMVVLAAFGLALGAATAPSASATAASTGSSTRSQGRDRAFTGTPQAGGSVPRHSLPP